jgi:hypothetical protein
MDLRAYYQKIRSIEADIKEESVVIVSRETEDGGRAGVRTEVPRRVAARMVVEEKADLATAEAAAEFRDAVEAKWRASLSRNSAQPSGKRF